MIQTSEKLAKARLELEIHEAKQTKTATVYNVVAGGVTVYLGTRYKEAFEAFDDSGRKDKVMWKLSTGTVKRLK